MERQLETLQNTFKKKKKMGAQLPRIPSGVDCAILDGWRKESWCWWNDDVARLREGSFTLR